MAVAPDKAVALFHIVFLEDLERVHIGGPHRRRHDAREARVELLAAVAAHDAGGTFVRRHDLAVEVPVLALRHHQLRLAEADADLSLYRVRERARVNVPAALDGAEDAFLIEADLRLDLAAEALLVRDKLLRLAHEILHRPASDAGRQRGAEDSDGERLLVAVRASDVEGLYPQI